MMKRVTKMVKQPDWLLLFRVSLAGLLMVEGYRTHAMTDLSIGIALAIYSLLAARFKWGCGYGSCSIPHNPNRSAQENKIQID
jgi:cytochrome b